MDMSAGIEHLTRGTARGVDMILVVTEPARAALRLRRWLSGFRRIWVYKGENLR